MIKQTLLLLLLLTVINLVKSSCRDNGTRFGLEWDKDLVALSIRRYIDANPQYDFNGCRRKELHLATFIFADNSFDVWLGNLRGNIYAQDHIDPNKKLEDFWNFSWDDMAEHDLPAMFDKIEEVTGQKKVWYLGHSQGVTIMLARLSTDPEFHKRLHAVFALAPVAKVKNIQGTIDGIMSTPSLMESLTDFYSEEGEMQLPMFSKEIMVLSTPVCLFFPAFCSQLMFFFIGSSSQHNDSNALIHVTITPEGTSLKNAWHWKQLYENGRFEKFNYDWKEVGGNQKHYGQDHPPAYDLTKIQNTSFYVYTGAEDTLSTEMDLHFLFEQLPYHNLKEHKNLENFGHLDFVFGTLAANQPFGPKLTTLDNGFRVVSEPIAEGYKTATVGVWIDAGSRYENEKNNGTAHFLEHMAFKGTTKRSQMGLELEVENIGAHLNAYTSREHTVYYAKCFEQDLEKAVEILSDILLDSVYGKNEVERERGVILREMEEVNQNMQEVVFDELHAGAFVNTSLSRTILGSENNIRTITRKDLVDYVQKYYKGPRMLLAAAGGVDHQHLVSLAQKYFGKVEHGPKDILDYEAGKFSASCQNINNPAMELMYGALTVEGTSWTHEDNIPMQIAHTLIGQYDQTCGNGLSSPTRLASKMEKLPEVASFMSFSTNYKDTGLSGIYFITHPDGAQKFAKLICDEWQSLANDPINQDALNRAKRTLYTNILLMLDGTTPIFEDIGRQILCLGRRMTVPELEARVNAVTTDTIMEVCRKYYIDQPFAHTVIGPTQNWPAPEQIQEWLSSRNR
ncbi:Beta-MPP [Aphelenchoides bicaudatus]|nr:Beta-MPP [Aphelenchoides bicaudatus]